MFITIFLSLLSQLNGNFVLLNYVTAIFKEAGSKLSPNHSSIVVGIVQLLANILATFFVDRLGRRVLMLFSTFGSALGLIATGLYTLHSDLLADHNWIPIVTFSATILVQSIGLVPLYIVFLNELFPKKVIN